MLWVHFSVFKYFDNEACIPFLRFIKKRKKSIWRADSPWEHKNIGFKDTQLPNVPLTYTTMMQIYGNAGKGVGNEDLPSEHFTECTSILKRWSAALGYCFNITDRSRSSTLRLKVTPRTWELVCLKLLVPTRLIWAFLWFPPGNQTLELPVEVTVHQPPPRELFLLTQEQIVPSGHWLPSFICPPDVSGNHMY